MILECQKIKPDPGASIGEKTKNWTRVEQRGRGKEKGFRGKPPKPLLFLVRPARSERQN